jgi:hypothetical protein
MIDDLVSKMTQATLASMPGNSATAGPAPAALSDAERFQAALNAPAVGSRADAVAYPVANAAVNSATASGASGSGIKTRSVGDAILDSFTQSASGVSRQWTEATQAVMRPDLTATELLQVQVKLINVSFELELLNKAVSKTTSNLEQTLKTQ